MKRILALLLVSVIAACTVVGCGSTAEKGSPVTEAEGTEQKTAAGTTLRIMMSSGDSGPGNIKKALEKAASIMGVALEYDVIPDDQMLNVANTKLTTGNAADIIIHNFGLTDVSTKDLAPLSGDWTDKITTISKPLCVDEGGNVYKAPLGGESNMGLLYNKKVLETSGVTLPIKNYQEFIGACDKIKAAGYTPVYISNKELWTAQILLLTTMTSVFQDNSELINKITTNQIKPSEVPELVELWENTVSLKELNYINEDYMSATNDMAFEALANGECAFYAQMDSAYGTLSEYYPEQVGDIGMTTTPLWEDEADGYVLFGTATNYMSAVANSENLELAKEFINTMLSEEALTTYYDLVPGMAPYTDLGFELNMSPFNQEMKGYAKTLPSLGDFNNSTYDGATPLEAFYGAFNEHVQGLFSGKTVTEAMDAWYDAYVADAQARRVEGF